MTKEEVIKEAWLQVFEENKVKQILSSCDKTTGFIEGFSLISFKLPTDSDKLERKFDGVVYNYRPKSLQNIESNNGWIKIESEEDLPNLTIKNKEYEFWIINNKDEISHLELSWLYTFKAMEKTHQPLSIITHYRPIEKPKPPIY